jgi:hypothetical protein
MSELERDPENDLEAEWEPTPPGFWDRPDVKEAVEWALAQVGKKGPRQPGLTIEEIEKLADERRRLDPPV